MNLLTYLRKTSQVKWNGGRLTETAHSCKLMQTVAEAAAAAIKHISFCTSILLMAQQGQESH